MAKGIEIRSLKASDYDDIIRIWNEAGLPIKPKGRDGRESMEAQIERDPDLYLGAFEDKELAGVVIGTFDGRKGYINRIAVAPSKQRKGIGTLLLKACEDALRKRGVEVITSLIELPNEASVGFFKWAGYFTHDDIVYISKRDRPGA